MAAALFAFIFLYERHLGTSPAEGQPPPRLLPRLQLAQVAAIQARRTNQFFIRAERHGESWRLTAPLSYPGAPVAVERLLTGLEAAVVFTRLSPREISRRGQQPADYGLDSPQASVVLEQGNDRVELQFGLHTTAGDQVYVQQVGVPGISVVDAALLDLLPVSLHEWRNLALVDWRGGEPDTVEIARPDGGLCLQRDLTNQVWQLSRPRLRADQFQVAALLEKIQQARVLRFVTDDPAADLESYGLAPPQAELVAARGSNVLQRVQLGKNPPGDPTNYYARLMNWTNVVLVPKALVEALQTPASEYRDRRLLTLQPESVSWIEVRSSEPFTLRRQTNGSWIAGETAPADAAFIQEWLRHLGQLRVIEFVKDVVTDFSPYGLAQPARQYLLRGAVTNATGATNALLADLQFGSNTLDKVYVRRADEDSVYAIRYWDYYPMPTAAWQLRDHRVWTFTTNQVQRVFVRERGRQRVLSRSASGEWSLTAGVPGEINPFALEEMAYRFGELTAPTWTARGASELPRYGFGATNLQVAIELKTGETNQTLTLDFGGPAPTRFPYAAAQVDGQVWIFEFPWALFQPLASALGLPLGDPPAAPTPAPGAAPPPPIAPRDPAAGSGGG